VYEKNRAMSVSLVFVGLSFFPDLEAMNRESFGAWYSTDYEIALPIGYFASALPGERGKKAYFPDTLNETLYIYHWELVADKKSFDQFKSTGVTDWLSHLGIEGVDWLHLAPISFKGVHSERPEYIPGTYYVAVRAGVMETTGDIYLSLAVYDGDTPQFKDAHGYLDTAALPPYDNLWATHRTAYYRNQR
jgi:hypothetical protein